MKRKKYPIWEFLTADKRNATDVHILRHAPEHMIKGTAWHDLGVP